MLVEAAVAIVVGILQLAIGLLSLWQQRRLRQAYREGKNFRGEKKRRETTHVLSPAPFDQDGRVIP
ncbi:hypothetical protein GQ44DRAFT_827055 [Phaeosphaeriaceae sp. PMI808]|nr:hypothetical protein GQ44DRAFT_827055 [Phaeosphaeriaceae sp. PMI808]